MDLQARSGEHEPGRVGVLLFGHAEQLITLLVPAVPGEELAEVNYTADLAGLDRHGLAQVLLRHLMLFSLFGDFRPSIELPRPLDLHAAGGRYGGERHRDESHPNAHRSTHSWASLQLNSLRSLPRFRRGSHVFHTKPTPAARGSTRRPLRESDAASSPKYCGKGERPEDLPSSEGTPVCRGSGRWLRVPHRLRHRAPRTWRCSAAA